MAESVSSPSIHGDAAGLESILQNDNDTKLCKQNRSMLHTKRLSSRVLWRRANSVVIGYPKHARPYLRLLALGLSDSLRLHEMSKFNALDRYCGREGLASNGWTMIGLVRLRNIAQLMLDVLSKNIPGDYAELGVWRGGTGIFTRAILDSMELMGQSRRLVHLFDAFDLMVPSYNPWTRLTLAVNPQDIVTWFELYGVDHHKVQFYRGLFKRTLPKFYEEHRASELKIAVLRIDANFHDSYQDALFYLYEFVPVGGYVIFDDVMTHPGATKAWLEFQSTQRLQEELIQIDSESAYFQKLQEIQVDFSKMMPASDANL